MYMVLLCAGSWSAQMGSSASWKYQDNATNFQDQGILFFEHSEYCRLTKVAGDIEYIP